MINLTEKHPIKKITILREVFGKVVFLIILSVVLLLIFKWNGAFTESVSNKATELIFSSAIVLIFFFLVVTDIIYEWLYILNYKYYTDGKSITIKKGVISRHEITLPFNRITDLYIDQGILDRILGIHDLHFSSPTSTSGSAAHIAGLGKQDCHEVRILILNSMNENSR